MKRIVTYFLIAILAISLAACGDAGTGNTAGQKRIGILQFLAHPAIDNITQGVMDELEIMGINKDNTIIDLQIANADNAVAATIAQKFVSDKCDVIVAITTGASQAAYNATRGTDIPVVFVAVSDPIGAGVIESKEKPNTNVTGISDLLDVAAELELVKNLLPEAKTIGIVYNAGEVNSANEVRLLKEKADTMGYKVVTVTITSTADVPLAMDSILGKVDVLVNTLDNTLVSALNVEIEKANEKNIPVIASANEQVDGGALASNGFDYYDVGIESVPIIKKVLDGTSPDKIPVENCKKTKMFINKAQAEKYGVEIPEGANIVE